MDAARDIKGKNQGHDAHNEQGESYRHLGAPLMVNMASCIKNKEQGHYTYDEQNESYLHFWIPFKASRPVIKNKRLKGIVPFVGSLNLMMGMPPCIKSKDQRHDRYGEQNKSSCHFLAPFKTTSPPIKNKRAQIRPRTSMRGLSSELVNTYMATMSFEISRRYVPRFDIWHSLNSISKAYRARWVLSRRDSWKTYRGTRDEGGRTVPFGDTFKNPYAAFSDVGLSHIGSYRHSEAEGRRISIIEILHSANAPFRMTTEYLNLGR